MLLATVLFTAVVGAAGGLPERAWADDDAPFSNLFVFGDSLSDTGNVFVVSGGAIPNPFSYFQGRFSNGPVYVEGLADRLGLEVTAALSGAGGTNFAFGGARTGQTEPPLFSPSLLDQVNAFLAGDPEVDPDALYVVFGGANDLRSVAFGVAPPTDIQASVNDIAAIITALAQAGANDILVPNLPNLGRTPESASFESLFPGFAANATAISESFNSALATTLDDLESSLDIDIHRLDVFSLLETVATKPKKFGFTNTTDPCIGSGDVIQDITEGDSTPCKNPKKYVFWDAIHPTARAHSILAEEAFRAVIDEDDDDH